MRWLVLTFLIILTILLSSRRQFITEPTEDIRRESVAGDVTPLPKPLQRSETTQNAELDRKLKESKPFLRDKSQVTDELAQNPHSTPPAIMTAALTLGEIAELEALHPESREEFLLFYKNCYESTETITVTRVQCLKRYLRSAQLDKSKSDSIIATLPTLEQRLYRKSLTF